MCKARYRNPYYINNLAQWLWFAVHWGSEAVATTTCDGWPQPLTRKYECNVRFILTFLMLDQPSPGRTFSLIHLKTRDKKKKYIKNRWTKTIYKDPPAIWIITQTFCSHVKQFLIHNIINRTGFEYVDRLTHPELVQVTALLKALVGTSFWRSGN